MRLLTWLPALYWEIFALPLLLSWANTTTALLTLHYSLRRGSGPKPHLFLFLLPHGECSRVAEGSWEPTRAAPRFHKLSCTTSLQEWLPACPPETLTTPLIFFPRALEQSRLFLQHSCCNRFCSPPQLRANCHANCEATDHYPQHRNSTSPSWLIS